MYQNKSRGIVATIIWCVVSGICVMPAVVLWGISFDTKTYQKLDDPVSPKVMSRTDENGKMLSPALHDMYPFIDEEEMKELMISTKGV